MGIAPSKKRAAVFCGAAGVLCAVASYAAQTNEIHTLPPVTVEASRTDAAASEMPQSVRTIGREEIAHSGASGVADLLMAKTTSLHVSHLGAGNPAMAQISPAGYGENGFGRLLVLVDGERLNNPDMSPPNLSQISLQGIERIEILSGPQSVLHGDGASAGMVNIVTEPADYAAHGGIEVRGGSWNTLGGSVYASGGDATNRVKYWSSAGWDHSDGWRTRSGYDIWNARGGAKKTWSGGSSLKLSAFYSDADWELPDALSRAQWHEDPRQSSNLGNFYRRTSYGLNVADSLVLDEDNTFKLAGTVSRRRMKSKTYGYWYVDYDMYSYRFSPEWINTSEIAGLGNEFLLGAEFRYDRNDANGSGGKYRLDRQTGGVFAQDTLEVADWLALRLGGRCERSWNGNSSAIPKASKNDLTAFDAAMLFKPADGMKAFVRFSRHYRNPFLDETSLRMLSPEKGWTADAGGDFEFLDGFSAGGNAYVSRLDREIFYNPYTWANVNSPDDTVRKGFNLRAAWERKKVAGVALSYSYVDAEFAGGRFKDNKVPAVPESTVALDGHVWLCGEVRLSGGYRWQSAMFSISDYDNVSPKTPGFGIFRAGIEWTPGFCKEIEGFKIGLSVDNLLGKNYCDYSTYGSQYYPGAGRCWMLTAGYSF